MRRSLLVILVVSALLGVGIGLVTNYASAEIPSFFKADPLRAWLVLGLLAQTSIIVALAGARIGATPPQAENIQRPPSRAAGRRRLFARELQRALLKSSEGWNDDHFTELEAEIEVGFAVRSRVPWSRRRRAVWRAPSLTDALRTSDERLIVLEGEPGSGKSVALRHLALRMAENAGQRPDEDSELPVYVNLKNFSVPADAPVSAAHVEKFVLDSLSPRPSRDVDTYLLENFERDRERGRLLFLFDSFDEIPAVLAEAEAGPVIDEYVEAISSFVGLERSRAIVASREFRGPSRTGLPRFRVMPLSQERRELFVRRADLDSAEERMLLDRMSTLETHLQQLTDNPLFLSLFCEYVRSRRAMPQNTHEVIEDYVRQRLSLDEDRVRARYGVDVTAMREFAEEMAFAMLAEPDLGLSTDRERIEKRFEDRERPASASIDALIYCGLLRADDDAWITFSHRRIQEYFATCAVIRGWGNVTRAALLTDGRWRETAVVILQTQAGEQATEMLDAINERLRDTSSAALWPPGSLYLLELMASALTPASIAEHPVAGAADDLLGRSWSEGSRLDRKWVVELCAAAGSDKAAAHLERAFESDSMWLRDEAFRQVRRTGSAASSLEPHIRQMLIDISADGQLRRERRSLHAQLHRLKLDKNFANFIDLLLAAPMVAIITFPIAFLLLTPFVRAPQVPILLISSSIATLGIWVFFQAWRWQMASPESRHRYAHSKGSRYAALLHSQQALPIILLILTTLVVQNISLVLNNDTLSPLERFSEVSFAAISVWVGILPFGALETVRRGTIMGRGSWPLITAYFARNAVVTLVSKLKAAMPTIAHIADTARSISDLFELDTLRRIVNSFRRIRLLPWLIFSPTLLAVALILASPAFQLPQFIINAAAAVGLIHFLLLNIAALALLIRKSVMSAQLRHKDHKFVESFFTTHSSTHVADLQEALSQIRSEHGINLFLADLRRRSLHFTPETSIFLTFLIEMIENNNSVSEKKAGDFSSTRSDWIEWWTSTTEPLDSPFLALTSETVDELGRILEEGSRETAFREPAQAFSSTAGTPTPRQRDRLECPAMGHVFARLAGHGMTLVPRWPYVFERTEGDTVLVTWATEDGPMRLTVEPGVRVDGGDVVDVTEGPDHPYWLIETGPALLPWPKGFSLESAEDQTPFLLLGPDDTVIFPQGPVPAERLADAQALVAEDQAITAERDENGTRVVELGYEHEGAPWWQAHWLAPLPGGRLLVVTAQAPLPAAAAAREAAATIAAGVVGRSERGRTASGQ